MTLPLLSVLSLAPLPPATIRLEAEDAALDGPTVATARPGFSGKGYATGLTKSKARIVWRVEARPGVYEACLRYGASGEKGAEIAANGARSSAMLPATGEAFATRSVGKVELRVGTNEVSVERGWGYYDVDYLELVPAPAPTPLKALPTRLVDPKATPEARALYARLLKGYGRETWSGQYEPGENAFVAQRTGQTPAILGGDLINYSPSRVAREKPKDVVPGMIEAVRAGQALTLSWHWNAPKDLIDDEHHRTADGKEENDLWYFGFYTRATTFDVTKALADPKGEDHALLLRDIDAIAVQLKRLQDAHVPVLWRPLHEAEGGWFWWGAKGPEPCKALYRLLFDRLTRLHGLHNLVWVWNSPKAEWYPGDDVVDVMSVDRYPDDRRDALSADWDDLRARFDGRKPLALAEFPGAPDVERMRRFGVRWLYFVSWSGGVGPKSTAPEVLKSTYGSKDVVNRP